MNIIVTGATGKLGQNIIKALNKLHNIIAFYRDDEKILKNENVSWIKCDLNCRGEILKCCKEIIEKNIRIDVIINNAAVDIDQDMLLTTSSEFESIMRVNLFAPYYIAQFFLPYMIKEHYGKIINISSDLSMRTTHHAVEYSISKAGLDALTRAIAVDFGQYGIVSNSINISGMRGMVVKVNEKIPLQSSEDKEYDDWKIKAEQIPMRRRGEFKEFTNVVNFLISDNSSYINGVNLPVDGGILARL